MSKKKSSLFEERLKKVAQQTLSPTQALMRSVKTDESDLEEETDEKEVVKKKKKSDETLKENEKTENDKKDDTVEKDEDNLADHDNKTTKQEDSETPNDLEIQKKGLTDLLQKKERVEDTHIRKTFLIRRDLSERLERYSKKNGKGFQKEFINYMIEIGLDELDSIQEEKKK